MGKLENVLAFDPHMHCSKVGTKIKPAFQTGVMPDGSANGSKEDQCRYFVGSFRPWLSLNATMDNSDMEFSPISRSNNSSRSSTPKPEKPLTDCERRRNAMDRLNKQQTMIAGYRNYLDNAKQTKDETGIRKEMEKYLKITIEARDQLKRKNTKTNSDDFVFPSKTARPTTPTKELEPVEVQNSYDNI
ncbi:uncharacterized protein TNCV_2466141 [Trichonephila clavipes]|nr:uncharacterized protein TNCV_2466141 [Trichonephila clavipes]